MSSLQSRLASFRSDEGGNVAVIFTIALLPLVSSVGAAVDFSHANAIKSKLQAAVDSTTLMIVKEAATISESQLQEKASTIFNNLFSRTEAEQIQVSAAYGGSEAGSVTVTVSTSMKTDFMGVVGVPSMQIVVKASAVVANGPEGCVLSLNPKASSAASVQGGTNLTLNGCSLYDNSASDTGLVIGGSAKITAASVSVVGGASGTEGITAKYGIHTNQSPIADPYAKVELDTFSGCTDKNFNANSSVTLNPGVYCGGISVTAGATVTLNPGVYYIDRGTLTVHGGATLEGTGVTLVFTSSTLSNWATASINGNATINLTAPTDGNLKGIVVFGDRRMPVGESFKFNGGSSQYFGGAIYLPKADVTFAGGAATSTGCTQLIADTASFVGNANLAVNCKALGTRPFSSKIVRLSS